MSAINHYLRQQGSTASRALWTWGRLSGCRIPQCTRLRASAFGSSLARYYASNSFPEHSVVTMPALSPTMTAGNIGTWQKQPGDTIAPGDVLVEIETDKAQMDFEFQDDGVLAKVLKESGEKDVAVGSPIAVMVEEGTDVSAFDSFTIEDAGGEKQPEEAPKGGSQATEPPDSGSDTSPEPKESEHTPEKASKGKDERSDQQSEDRSKSGSKAQPVAEEETTSSGRLEPALHRQSNILPRARTLALDKGIPLEKVKGTGPNGVVTEDDVRKYQPKSAVPAAVDPAAPQPGASYLDEKPSSMRKTIAERLQQSMQVSPHYYVQSNISVSKLLKLRTALNASADGKYKLSVNDFMIKAVAIACKKVPVVNSSWRAQHGVIRKFQSVDVSVAVATPIGLMTPIVHNADSIGLEAISAAVKELGKKARDGKLKPEQYTGGTVTISNMGMNPAVERFTAIINPPQAAIAAIGAVRKVPVPLAAEGDSDENSAASPTFAWDEQIVISTSFDHRVIDGAVGGEFMRELKNVIENPLNMLL